SAAARTAPPTRTSWRKHARRADRRSIRAAPMVIRALSARVRAEVHPHRLDLGVELERGLAHLAAEAALLVAAEGRGGVEDVVAIDPDRSRLERLGELVRLRDVGGPDRGGEAVRRVVSGLRDLLHVLERDRADDRSEDLFLQDLRVG